MPAAKKRTYVAIESGSCEIDGRAYYFTKGRTHVAEGHELLKVYPDFFAPTEDRVDYDVEKATAAPGEKRGQ